MAKARDYKGGWHHDDANWKNKVCAVCSNSFIPKSGSHKFCSAQCKNKWKYVSGEVTTESQYKKISGNWSRYASRLLYFSGRKRDNLSREDILDKLKEQNYKCALSGVDLTCNLEKGNIFKTNASIDRIEAGGPYTKDNIQIVCRALNSWRADLTVDDFIEWCRKVVSYADKNKEDT